MLTSQVNLVADEDDVASSVSWWVVYEVGYLVGDLLERFSIGDVIDRDAPVWIPEIGLRDRVEALLASGVPDLDLCNLVVDLKRLHLKVDTDGVHVSFSESFVHEPHKQWCLSSVRGANEDNLQYSIRCLASESNTIFHTFAHTAPYINQFLLFTDELKSASKL